MINVETKKGECSLSCQGNISELASDMVVIIKAISDVLGEEEGNIFKLGLLYGLSVAENMNKEKEEKE